VAEKPRWISFRASNEDFEALEIVARHFKCSRSEAIRKAIRFVAKLIQEAG